MRSGSKKRADAIGVIRGDLEAGRLREAYEAATRLVYKNPKDAEAHFLIGLVAERTGQAEIARTHAERSLTLRTHADTLFLLSRIERQVGNTDTSLAACDRALELSPGSAALLIHRAGTLEEAGRFAEARSAVDPLVRRYEADGSPLPAPLSYELAKLLVQEKRYDSAVNLIDEVVTGQSTPAQLVRLLCYLQSKAHDRAGRFDAAMASAEKANGIGRIEFDPKLYEQQVSALIEQWSAERMSRFPRCDNESEIPVFIAGMPRSGTSLVDQIIDAHPHASGVGEMSALENFAGKLSEAYDPSLEPPMCFGKYDRFLWNRAASEYISNVRAQSPSASVRVVNKALGNNKIVGLLSCLFPQTRIIHMLRDPRDVAISCYMGGFNNMMHPWTTRLGWVSAAWEQSLRLMEHWRSTLDVPIHDLKYEELVAQPERHARELIKFLGLDWNPACLEFHKTKRTVRTLSYDQVNRPLYRTSVGRHRCYESHMAGVSFPTYNV